MIATIALVFVLALSGCAAKAPDVWHRPDSYTGPYAAPSAATAMQYKQDAYACERDQPVIYCPEFMYDLGRCQNRVRREQQDRFRRCMESKGWERQPDTVKRETR
jgi:hypothetical protein